MLALTLRWAFRDAKARWVQVAGIALMIAIGTGLFAGLSSFTHWRIISNEESLQLTNMYDVRARLGEDGFLPQGALAAMAEGIDGVAAVEERLITETQAEVDTAEGAALVRARIIGVNMAGGGPDVNGVEVIAGRGIREAEFGEPVVLIERNFGVYYELPDEGDLRLGGDVSTRYVGQAVSPEYFIVVEEGSFIGQANLVAVFAPLETAQRLSDRPGLVNDLVLTADPGADLSAIEDALLARTSERHAGTQLTLMRPEDDASYLALTQDPEGDQQIYNVMALVLFGGAAFAALNFAARMVETQRREIGTSMALGVSPVLIALRPVLVGVQIAVLGVVFGVGIGLLVGRLLAGTLEAFLALPIFITPFQTEVFLRVAAIGFFLPILAVLWPVFRATRVKPVEAIKTGHLASRGGGLAPLISRIPLPGGSLGRMPFRNLLRAPRRTLLTLLALTAVLAILFGIGGMRDSFLSTLQKGDEELLRGAPDRLTVRLDSYYPVDSPEVTSIVEGGALGVAEPGLTIAAAAVPPGELGVPSGALDVQSAVETLHRVGDSAIELNVQFLDFQSDFWTPSVVEGELSGDEPGVVLARKAASDLGVGVGDDVDLIHPMRTGTGLFTAKASTVPVIGIHPHPLRFYAYMDIRHAGLAGLEGAANTITGTPADQSDLFGVKRALFGDPGVTAVQGLSEAFEATAELFEQVSSVFLIVQIFVLGLVLLIAFNAANINSDERARDHATMFAYGVSVRRVVGSLATEGLVLGALAALLGVVFGYALLLWMVNVLVPQSYPDMGVLLSINAPAMAVLLAAGAAVVGLAPALTVRKLRRMDIPGTLRVLE